MHDSPCFAFQRLDVYVASRELVRLVHLAKIRDTELRDQANRASKSVLLSLAEGLPSRRPNVRRVYFERARGSLFETVAAVDAAGATDVVDAEAARTIQSLSNRIDMMLQRLLR